MGVFGLLSTCLERREECVNYVDLVEVAQQRNGIEIMVDFYSFEHMVLNAFWKSMSAVSNNPCLRILGGEYKTLDAYLTKLIKDLQSLDIHLVMFVDGAKGSSSGATEQKMETWQRRHRQDQDKLTEILEVCSGQRKITDLSDRANTRPVCLEIQVFETLKRCNCEVVQLVSGEADYVIARNLMSRPKAYAVISNDSDFCIFQDCKFIPNELFDLQKDLRLGEAQLEPDKPLRLIVGIVSAAKVVGLLELHDHSELIELSILAGNDLTGPHMHSLRGRVGLKGRVSLSQVADWVRQYRRVENHPQIQQEMTRNRRLTDAIQKSREFYTLSQVIEVMPGDSIIGTYLSQGIEAGHFPGSVMAMHRNFYWHRLLLEDIGYGVPCIEGALAPLRSHLYRMMLERNHNTVTEHGRTPYNKMQALQVHASHARLPTVNFVNKDKMFQNLGTFKRIMTHLEPDSQTEWHKRYGWRNGFTCYVLRYYLILNTEHYLCLTQPEFMAAVAMVFCQVDEVWYMGLPLVPSTRCVTALNWLQDIYRHAYQFLGKLLFLTHEFPEPKNLFSGAVWTAFFMLSAHQGYVSSRLHPQCVQRIRHDMDFIIKEKRHMIRYIVEGIFPFDTRF